MRRGLAVAALAALASIALAVAWAGAQWLVSLLTLALAKGLVVLGLLLLMRTGLVSFGQGLYFGLGAYAAALLGRWGGLEDTALMLLAGAIGAGLVAAALGVLLARYRDIFFAMLSLAFSMIFYGLLVKSAALGSTDGFKLHAKTFAGLALAEGTERRVALAAGVVVVAAAAWLLRRLLAGHWGRVSAAIRDNELRVDYLGASVYRVVYANYVIAGALGGLGGALAALAVGHVDPDSTTNWTISGEFVFIAVLGGIGSVLAPFLSATVFEGLRTLASQYAPHVWQMSLGLAMLAIIMFLPAGLWSLARRRRSPT